jgi:hypothetical protein
MRASHRPWLSTSHHTLVVTSGHHVNAYEDSPHTLPSAAHHIADAHKSELEHMVRWLARMLEQSLVPVEKGILRVVGPAGRVAQEAVARKLDPDREGDWMEPHVREGLFVIA